MIETLLNTSRKNKRIISVFTDLLFLPFAFWVAMSLRWETFYLPDTLDIYVVTIVTTLASIAVFIRLGLYRAVIRYMSHHASFAVISGVTISALVLGSSGFLLKAPIPRSVPLIYWCMALLFVGGSRMMIRSIVRHRLMKAKERVIIYGAGRAGLQLSSMLYQGQEYLPIAFVDDNGMRQGMILNGLRVFSPADLNLIVSKYGASRILLALGSAPRSQRGLILRYLEDLPVKVQTIPSMTDIVKGKARIEEIRDIDIDDLLGRDEVEPDHRLMKACIEGKSVMVTGAGGSIGSELCRQIIEYNPKKLVLFELSEFALYKIEQELIQEITRRNLPINLKAIMGSVQREHRLEVIMKSFGVDTVYHAAAYKHVPMVEQNVIEGVRNNVFGTWYAAEAAIKAHVETFILISTDKAVRPTNVMGASKRLAELVLQGVSDREKTTRFCIVRFGNVLGSSGSVVPLFREQIQNGGPVTVTHQDVIRYFMTIPEAAQLVLQAGSLGKSGEVFVLDMGEQVKIADLAKKMIHLMGLELKDENNPQGDIEITYTGLRLGEKLFEELLVGNDPVGTKHSRIMMAQETFLKWNDMHRLLKELDKACHEFDVDRVRRILMAAPTDYTPECDISDLVWLKNTPDGSLSNVAVLPSVKVE